VRLERGEKGNFKEKRSNIDEFPACPPTEALRDLSPVALCGGGRWDPKVSPVEKRLKGEN